jgi:metallo-beta-lactamase class B
VTPRLVGIAIVFATAVCAGVSARGDEPASWRERVAPFRIAGDTWYVGSRGLSVIAIRTGAGVIVIDAGLPGAENEILANLASIGIAPHDVKFLLTSHAHYDHVGGLAALKAATGATVVATHETADLLARGGRNDLHFGDRVPYPGVKTDRYIGDGESVTSGTHVLTAVQTPGHTPGGTTWIWSERSAGESFAVVYADSLTAPGYRLVGNARSPRIADDFRASAARIAALRCDVLLTPHPEASDLWQRLAARSDPDAPLRGGDCRRYAETAMAALETRVREQSADPPDGRMEPPQ